jgi:hypothetical protein
MLGQCWGTVSVVFRGIFSAQLSAFDLVGTHQIFVECVSKCMNLSQHWVTEPGLALRSLWFIHLVLNY